jgi:hypothetical protein
MDNLNAGVAGKSGPVEGENGGEAMHMHGGDQPGIVRGLPGNPVLIYQALPHRINSRGIGQQGKHILQARQFGRRLAGSQPQTVLGNRPRGHHPQLDQVLRNDVKLAAPRGQSFDRNASRFRAADATAAGSEAMCWYR